MNDGKQRPTSTIIALAGRRIDSPDAKEPRFPLKNVDKVRRRIAETLGRLHAIGLVCSAACGADLVALEAAEELGVPRRVVLPFAADLFRKTSVNDWPGDWKSVCDRQIAEAAAAHDLVVLDRNLDDDQAYAAANEAIVREAQALAKGGAHRLVAILVWEGAKRQGSDATAGFGVLARKAGFEELSISTS
jgi:hypothetical protein